ncbi:MAG: hypothetical protein EXR75_03220 [Myxococcales bacterium]|nr:hypothetical protein [Myxococcales bacterium]
MTPTNLDTDLHTGTATVTMTLDDGRTARVTRLEGERIQLFAPGAAAPGSRLSGTVAAGALRLKVHGCVRRSDGTFAVRGVTLDLRREVRAAIIAALTNPPATPN